LLRMLGFAEQAGDHRWFVLYHQGRFVLRTKTSRGTGHRTIGEPMVREMARELRINRLFLYELVDGAKTKDDYFAELRRQGLID